jgi:hypothetical protein
MYFFRQSTAAWLAYFSLRRISQRAGMLSLLFEPLLHPLAVEIGQNRRNRGIKVVRNGLPRFELVVEGARQWRILDDRNPSPLCLFPDLRRQQVAALGQQPGRLHGLEAEAQRHGIVGRVGDHH